jgi:hypothetical protein
MGRESAVVFDTPLPNVISKYITYVTVHSNHMNLGAYTVAGHYR